MDALAVYEATQEDLHHLGLTEKGHILCLKYFAMKNCQSNVKDDEKKETLANSIKQCSNERTTKRVKRHQTKSVQIGWKHASSGSMFVQVRKQSGGGVRESTFSNSDTLLKIKNEAINLFFPGGKSKKYGYSQNVSTSLGDFSGDVIEDLNCTISNYNHRIKMTGRMRLYLLTKRKNDIKEMLLRDPVQLTSSDSDDDFDIPVMDNNSIEAGITI